MQEAALPAAGRAGKEEALVQAMFDRVAPRYDLANTVLSGGQDAHWRRAVAIAADPAGRHFLDVASGPGNIARELIRRGAASVTALDLSLNMLRTGMAAAPPDVSWVNGDAQQLPFPDATFDGVTISFGLRNIPDPQKALAEFARVTKPGGPLVVCEFAAPTWEPFRKLYLTYLVGALPRVAHLVSSDGPAYGYLAESIQQWPDRSAIGSWLREAGWDRVQVKNLTGGIVALHRGWRA